MSSVYWNSYLTTYNYWWDRLDMGMARKKCIKGKSCKSTCIAKGKICREELKGDVKTAADMVAKAVKDPSQNRLAGTIGEIAPDSIQVDPKRFQYKIIGEHTKTGEVGSLTDVQRYDPNLGGILQVWQDPSDGKTYVVNGHNRLALAKKLGAEKVAVRYLDVKDAQEARAVGALTNIAEGRGNALDAAKFFRDTGLSQDDLQKKGIPMKERIATDGLSLSRLDDGLFRKVIDGDIPMERGVIIGGSGLSKAEQKSLVDLLEKQPKSKNITNEVISELVQTIKASGSHSDFVMDLFGGSTQTASNALERASLQASIRKRLSTDKKLFGTVSRSRAAEQLASAGNVINRQESQRISQEAASILGVFDQLKNVSGPISRSINDAANKIMQGGDRKTILSNLYNEISKNVKERNL